ncbi:MAG: DUF1934 domain-containing protein [Lachnospiraceae bacterium]|nr:DUF1934 domain-containing protein [Lachnospiraceae bacterium]
MKVNLEYESIDMDGETHTSKVLALMEIKKLYYRLVFVEDLSGEGSMTRSIMMLSKEAMRLIRKGEINTDFVFDTTLTHNTSYVTPFGNIPVTLTTETYDFSVSHPEFEEENPMSKEIIPADFSINAYASYYISIDGQAIPMSMKVKVTPA